MTLLCPVKRQFGMDSRVFTGGWRLRDNRAESGAKDLPQTTTLYLR